MTALEQAANDLYRKMSAQFFIAGTKREFVDIMVREMEPLVIEQRPLVFSEADERINSEQASQILALLKSRRSIGATNIELKDIGLRYGGRIHELRRPPHNYKIACTKESARVFKYTLAPSDW